MRTSPRVRARRGLARLWLITIVLVAAAGVLWSLAEDEVVERGELVGHATVTYETTETEVDPLLAALTGASAVLAVGSGYLLVHRSFIGRDGSSPDWMTAIGLLLLFAVLGAAAAILAAVRDTPEGYESVEEVVRAMRSHGIECGELAIDPFTTREAGKFFDATGTCRIEARQDLEDGYDDVLIGVSTHRGSGERLEEQVAPGRAGFFLIRDTWFVQCQFTSTCAIIKNEIGRP